MGISKSKDIGVDLETKMITDICDFLKLDGVARSNIKSIGFHNLESIDFFLYDNIPNYAEFIER